MTRPRQEAYALAKLQEQGYHVYLPLLTTWVRRSGQWCRQHKPMFPRYAFVRPAHAGQAIGPVRSTPGVTCMVRFGVVLAGLADARLAALRQVVDARNACLPQQPFAAGQHVLFASGPLAGLQGIVSSVAAERVTVLMQLLGQDQAVVVPFKDLQAQAFL
jgi:transcriptional antiterminator RfaH